MSRNQALAVLISLMLVGFALRVYQIDMVSFRGDEAFTVLNWVSRPLHETLASEIPLKDPQPPLAFALFRGWSLIFGTSEFSMRILPALLSIIGIPAMYGLGLQLKNRTTGLLAALLWALHPFLIWHAQDTKAYAIWAAVSATGLWLALRALKKQRRIDWMLYIGAATTAAYLYYLELFSVAALNLYVFLSYRKRPDLLKQWIISQIIIGLLLAPWYLQERLLFGSGYSGTTFPFEPQQIFTWLIPALNFGRNTLSEDFLQAIAPAVWMALVIGWAAWWRVNRRTALLMGLSGFLPAALLSLVSLRMNVFEPRYILSALPAHILLVATLVVHTKNALKIQPARTWLPIVIVAGWLFISLISLRNYYFDPAFAKAPDWRGLVSYLHTHATPDDLVVQAAADEAFTLYFDNFSAFERLPANPRQPDVEIVQTLEHAHDHNRSIWLVAQTPDDWPNAHIGPDWLNTHMQAVRELNVGGLRVEQYMPWQVREAEIETSVLAIFEDVAEMVGAQTVFETPNVLLGWVYWRPVTTTEQPLKVFVHLIGEVNPAAGTPLWSQDDHFPQAGRIQTTSWASDTLYRDIFRLSLEDVPPGEYEVLVGLYDPETNQRVPVDGQDSFRITAITVPPAR